MKTLAFLTLFFFLPLNAQTQAPGLLLKVENELTLKEPVLKKHMARSQLILEKYYPTARVAVFSQAGKEGLKDEELHLLCQELTEIKGVQICEVNRRLGPEDRAHPCRFEGDFFLLDLLQGQVQEVDTSLCRVTSSRLYDEFRLHGRSDLSPLWAQEYTGSDLLREKMQAISSGDLSELVGIWDSSELEHGENVSQLIASAHPIAPIPLDGPPLVYRDLNLTEDAVASYELAVQECHKNQNCPQYINNSMSWRESDLIRSFFSDIQQNWGGFGIVSAGNEHLQVDSSKEIASEEEAIILVGSLDSQGLPSEFTNTSSEIIVSAPSNRELASSNFESQAQVFGGTSGAAPQVTGALAAFSLISEHRLTRAQARRLLEKTGLPLPGIPYESSMIGRGILNSFKIGEVGKRLKEQCPPEAVHSEACLNEALEGEAVYDFSDLPIGSVKEDVEDVFPYCGGDKEGEESAMLDCGEKRELVKQLRRSAYLTLNHDLFALISCLSERDGYTENALFYQNVSEALKNPPARLSKSISARYIPQESLNEGLAGDFTGRDFRGIPGFLILQAFEKAKRRVDMSQSTLSGVDFSSADLKGAVFTKAILDRSNLGRANLNGANLENASLDVANLRGASLERAVFKEAKLSWANFNGSNLKNADLTTSDLNRASFSGADLRGADLRGSNLSGSVFMFADLRGADLREADLSEANFEGAIFDEQTQVPVNFWSEHPTLTRP